MTDSVFLGQLFIVLLLLIPMLLLGVAGWVFQLRRRKRGTSPISAGLLRPAGYSLSQQIVDRQLDMGAAFAFCMLSLLLPYAWFLQETVSAHASGTPGPSPMSTMVIALLLLTAAVTYAIFSLKRVAALRTGLEAETAIGQALEPMIGRGYRVFHDIPADGFNIDHLAVGPGGVYVFETKGRTKPLRLREGRLRKDYEVTFRDGALEFPGWHEKAPVEQTLAITRWTSQWLSRATGKPVEARGVLAIPGWWIERRSAPPPWITNGTNIERVFAKPGEIILDAERIEQICYQVEQRVRVRGLATDSAEAQQR